MLSSGRSVRTMSWVNRWRRMTASPTQSSVCCAEKPYRMSFPTSVMSARVGSAGDRSSCRHKPHSRMPGSLRTRNVLWTPYDRPWPRAASTSTFGPQAARAVVTTVWNPRVRLLAPSATTRAISASIDPPRRSPAMLARFPPPGAETHDAEGWHTVRVFISSTRRQPGMPGMRPREGPHDEATSSRATRRKNERVRRVRRVLARAAWLRDTPVFWTGRHERPSAPRGMPAPRERAAATARRARGCVRRSAGRPVCGRARVPFSRVRESSSRARWTREGRHGLRAESGDLVDRARHPGTRSRDRAGHRGDGEVPERRFAAHRIRAGLA